LDQNNVVACFCYKYVRQAAALITVSQQQSIAALNTMAPSTLKFTGSSAVVKELQATVAFVGDEDPSPIFREFALPSYTLDTPTSWFLISSLRSPGVCLSAEVHMEEH
jgi:hypothetical protein